MSELDDLRAAFVELMGAERRLRGRDPQRPGDLTHGQVRALLALDRDEEVTAGWLAKQAEMSPASVTAMLDKLEQGGMVERRRSATDRRQVIVALTDEGRKRLAERRAVFLERWRAGLAEHSPEELAAAARVMRSVARMLDET